MTQFLLATTALLCGISIGLITGVLLTWGLFVRQPSEGAEPDYSGGL